MAAAAVALGAVWAATRAVNRGLVRVRGASMQPTLEQGELLLTRPVRNVSRLAPGRVVVVEDPLTPGHLVIKRVEHVTSPPATPRRMAPALALVTVLGDAPDASTDSRHWGPLPARAVRRVAVTRWPSLARAGLRHRR